MPKNTATNASATRRARLGRHANQATLTYTSSASASAETERKRRRELVEVGPVLPTWNVQVEPEVPVSTLSSSNRNVSIVWMPSMY